MKRLLVLLLLPLLLLAGCAGTETAPPAPEPSSALSPSAEPAPTPEPTPEPTPTPPSSVTLTNETAGEILALADNPLLREVDGSASVEYEAMAALQRLRPDCEVRYVYPWSGGPLESGTTELSFTSADGAEEALRCLPRLERVDMRAVAWSTEDMERLEEQYPEIDFIWTLHFGSWTVTSDITCFSTLRTGMDGSHRYSNEELYPLLRFCHHLRALDLGHNALTDLTLIGRMSELQVLILADNGTLTDISPLAELSELWYLELFLCRDIADFTPLRSLTRLMDVNLCYDRYFDDLSLLDGCAELENVWLRFTGVSREQAAAFLEAHPNATLLIGGSSDPSSTAYGWRETERNAAIRNAFTYWPTVVDWRRWDDIEYQP